VNCTKQCTRGTFTNAKQETRGIYKEHWTYCASMNL